MTSRSWTPQSPQSQSQPHTTPHTHSRQPLSLFFYCDDATRSVGLILTVQLNSNQLIHSCSLFSCSTSSFFPSRHHWWSWRRWRRWWRGRGTRGGTRRRRRRRRRAGRRVWVWVWVWRWGWRWTRGWWWRWSRRRRRRARGRWGAGALSASTTSLTCSSLLHVGLRESRCRNKGSCGLLLLLFFLGGKLQVKSVFLLLF